jgi:LPS export ABC transporter protein LptC
MNARATQGIATDDGKKVTLIGSAYAIRHPHDSSPKIELRGERLVALPDEDRVVSSDPVQITRDTDVFNAESMNFNSNTGEYLLQGRVRGMLMPKPKN